ncbi:MAG TPA: hypothetical protein VFU07_08160 [Candidatus Lumbricidophila sp.]|nr:hypothetical protein [Candidatus Lumbricidophila sp.]
MASQLVLADGQSLGDLHTYLKRAQRLEDGSARLIGDHGVLAAYTPVLYPRGLSDDLPTVLGLRTFAVVGQDSLDVVVPIRSLIDRVEYLVDVLERNAEAPGLLELPHEVASITWAGISPPRGGWRAVGTVDPAELTSVAKAGIDEVAAALPSGTGEQLVHRVRSEVWGAPMAKHEFLPAGAAFAAFSLGFLGDDEIAVYETGPWMRLSTRRGHVLVRQRSWSLRG